MVFSFKKLNRPDRFAAAILFLSGMWVFASGAARLGFYYDDSGFLLQLPAISKPAELWYEIRNYVPGRNLHVLWQYLIFGLVRDPARHLTALHIIQSAFDAAVIVAFYFLLRRLRLSAASSFAAAALFAFWPIHGETHFWMSAFPMNILSTLFVIGFAWTSLSLTSAGRKSVWVWVADVAAFWCAILTYDQTFVALALILVMRIAWAVYHRNPQWKVFVSFHTLHVAAIAFFLYLRFTSAGLGLVPFERANAWKTFGNNIIYSFLVNGGHIGMDAVRTLWQKATDIDRLPAAVIAALVAVAGLWLVRDTAVLSHRKRLMLLAIACLFWIAAYFPIWLWNQSPRHHYLPTLGTFCTVAVIVDWLQQNLPNRLVSAAVFTAVAIFIFDSVVAVRGESRYWEEAFVSKKRLMSDIRPHIGGKRGLVLEDFPMLDGPAPFITPHDAGFAPRILIPDAHLPQDFHGSLKATKDSEGIVMDPNSTVPGPAPPLIPASDMLWLRCTGFSDGVLRYSAAP